MIKNDSTKTEEKKKSPYDYSAENDSILDHFMQKHILPPMLEKVIPSGLPANLITCFSNGCCTLAFIIAMLSLKGNRAVWFAIPVLVLLYLLGDNLDGAQARKTHTGSPLGEFMDHFLDCFVNAELMIPIILCYKLTNDWVITSLLFVAYITQAAAFWERYSLGHMHFAKFSSSETVVALDIILTLAYCTPLVNYLQNPLCSLGFASALSAGSFAWLGNLKLCEIVIVGFTFCAIFSTICNFIRTKGASFRFWVYFAAALLLALMFAISGKTWYNLGLFIFCLHSIDYISALITRIVDKKKDPYPDFILPAFVLVMMVLKINTPLVLVLELVYISVKILFRAIRFIHGHSQYWYWKNPVSKDE